VVYGVADGEEHLWRFRSLDLKRALALATLAGALLRLRNAIPSQFDDHEEVQWEFEIMAQIFEHPLQMFATKTNVILKAVQSEDVHQPISKSGIMYFLANIQLSSVTIKSSSACVNGLTFWRYSQSLTRSQTSQLSSGSDTSLVRVSSMGFLKHAHAHLKERTFTNQDSSVDQPIDLLRTDKNFDD
jgi:hypothetical protein